MRILHGTWIPNAETEVLRILPPDKQQEALDFVEFLLTKMQKQELSAQ